MTAIFTTLQSGGAVVIKTLEVNYFRCFKHRRLSNLKRINIIVGRNASGKTAFLEALYIASGAAPDLYFKLRTWRGLTPTVRVSSDLSTHYGIWRDLFYNGDETTPPTIAFKGTPALTRTLKIFFSSGAERTLQLKVQADSRPSIPIVFEWKRGQRLIGTSRAWFDGSEIKMDGSGVPIRASFYTSASPIEPHSTADRFSDLSKKNQQPPITKTICDIFPFINNVEVLSHHGSPVLHANGPAFSEKIPLGLVSSGVNKLVAILIDLINFHNGIVIVDEIENGFYFDTLPTIWKRIFELSKEHGTQLFLSTHSLEALKAVLAAIPGHETEFCLIRTSRENGSCTVKQIAGRDFEAALEEGVEVR